MKRVLVLLPCLFALAAAAGAGEIDRVAVVVNGRPITVAEVARETAFVAVTGLTPVDPQLLPAGGEIVDQMIVALLLRQRAERAGIRVEQTDVDAAIGRIAANNRISAGELEGRLKDGRGTWELFRERMVDRLLQPRLIDREVFSGVIVTEGDLAAEYEARRAELAEPAEVRVSHIVFPLSEGADEAQVTAVVAKAAAIRGRIAEGAGFAELVAEASAQGGSGGDLGWFRKGALAPALEEAAFGLPAGAVAGPVRTATGVHLLMVTERREERTPQLDEVRRQLAGELQRRRVGASLADYLASLRAEAVIRYPR